MSSRLAKSRNSAADPPGPVTHPSVPDDDRSGAPSRADRESARDAETDRPRAQTDRSRAPADRRPETPNLLPHFTKRVQLDHELKLEVGADGKKGWLEDNVASRRPPSPRPPAPVEPDAEIREPAPSKPPAEDGSL